MIKDISRHIEELVANIDNTLNGTFDSVEEVTNMCKTKYSRSGKYVTNELDEKFLITQVETDEYIKAGTANGILSLAVPYYINGTKIATNREWTIADENLFNKTPLIF